ncbi:uncharacterized protein LOC112575392 isoform X2 [Pomacea canaliculata]|uniref:uncharacterized protein LOC112575392 isoform X2 n=2 Tax=Pomacea canaliculata TaxID=400727 RepID=UPI000D7275B8|nr:uncharacterized protein LOC112575392 isoform X2 [Pomacea canaliculata]
MAAPGMLSVFLVCTLFVTVQSWSGNVCTVQKVTYNSRSECRQYFLWWCSTWVSIPYPEYYMENVCCLGWRDNGGDQNCKIPICTPPCQNGGTCIAPNRCQCQVQNTGQFCDGSVCSHLSPCYPGRCITPDGCDCTSGFTTTTTRYENCLTIEDNRNTDIKIYQMQVRMSNWPRGTTSPNESYYIMADSTQKTEMDFWWSNQKDFNRLETSCSSQFFMPDLPLKPNYIGNTGFGVVSGRVEVWLSKRPVYPSQPRFSSLNNTFPCVQSASSTQPVSDLYQCNLYITNFDRLLEHGDFLRITFRTEGGGYRELLDRNFNPPRSYATQTYRPINNSLSVEFRFDFKPPYHCDETHNCRSGETILDVPDITKVAPLRISWIGWVDDDSKMYRYSMEVFKMTKTTDNKLEIRVDRALLPIINREVFEANYTTQEYTPPEPGMYSIILEAGDRANNTKYVRRLCLYDPSSQITSDPSYRLYVTSASDAANYNYQSSLSTPVSVNWTNYFRNALHEDNALLGEVLVYPTQLENGKKNIPREGPLDDHQGRRTVDAIPNERGITNFKAGFAKDHDGGRNQSLTPTIPPSGWTDLGLNTTYTLPQDLRPSEADTVTVWVKATDAMGNERIERTQVTFDTSPPVVQNLKLYMNVPVPGVDFSSMFDLTAKDKESGVAYVLWTFRRGSGVVLYQEKVPGIRSDEKSCSQDFTRCDCTPAGDCFVFNQSYAFSNCHMMVEKEKLSTENITVTADVTNMAGLVTRHTWTKQDITELNGTKAYFPPQNVNVSLITSDSVMVTWTFPPSCFQRNALWVIANGRKVPVHKDATEFSLTGLDSDTVYTIHMVTEYEGDQQSDSESVSFKTAENNSFTAGSIVGIVIGLLILVAMVTFIVLFVLWRKGKVLQTGAGNKGMKAVEDFRRRTVHAVRRSAFVNNAYAAGGDDIYQYSDMAFKSRQTWQFDTNSVTLVNLVTEGRFATIYTANISGRRETVAVKMLKRGFSEDDARKMMGKINFFGTRLGEHEHVLQFIGAVTDHPEWGPTLILEYCEEGQLDQWLVPRRQAINDDVMEHLFQFSRDIASGMQYLASKRIVHNRLAARNILITALMEVRIAGFGSEGNEDGNTGQPEAAGEAKAQAETRGEKTAKIPIKWAAPEVLVNKPGTEKSDVWSYGIVLWEIFSMGQVPYPNMHSANLGSKINGGYRMDKPEICDDIHYQVMRDCWQYKPNKRPTFHTIHSTLSKQFTNRTSAGFYYDTTGIQNALNQKR